MKRQGISKQQIQNEGCQDGKDDRQYKRQEKHTSGHFNNDYLKGYRIGFYSVSEVF